jgi:hypothetical protein
MTAARARMPALAVLTAALVLAASGRADAVEGVSAAARGLAHARLYVDPAVSGTVDTRTRTRIEAALAKRREPILVALVAFAPGDAFDGDGGRFVAALSGRARRPGVYVTYESRGTLATAAYLVEPDVAARVAQAARVVDLEDRFDGPPGPRLVRFLAALDDPDLDAREAREDAEFRAEIDAARPQPGAVEDSAGGPPWIAIAAVAIAIAVAAAAALLWRRRRRARHVDDRPLLPGQIFALAREATREDLADRADAMLVELSALIDATPPSDRAQRALDAYEAADRVLRRDDRDVPDLVGALVCIELGRAALHDGPVQPPPCTYDPRHGPSHGRPVTVDATALRLCRACRADLRAHRPADVLRDGSGRPYLDGDSPWAQSGYGAWSDPIRAVLDPR